MAHSCRLPSWHTIFTSMQLQHEHACREVIERIRCHQKDGIDAAAVSSQRRCDVMGHGRRSGRSTSSPPSRRSSPPAGPAAGSRLAGSRWCATAFLVASHCRFTAFLVAFHCLFTAFLVASHCLFTAFLVAFHCRFTAFLVAFHCRFTAFLVAFHCRFTAFPWPPTAVSPPSGAGRADQARAGHGRPGGLRAADGRGDRRRVWPDRRGDACAEGPGAGQQALTARPAPSLRSLLRSLLLPPPAARGSSSPPCCRGPCRAAECSRSATPPL